jgi:adenosylmethionine-8-amino-7-oxononanoate aminotransferase
VTFAFPHSPVFYRKLARTFPQIVRGEGVYLFDADGKRYLDGSSGALVASVGHGVREIADEVAAQMREVAYVNGTMFTNVAVEALARELEAVLPPSLRYGYFLCSGSEAVEAAVKLARQYWTERGRGSKWKVISRVPSYHGNTLAALSLSGREHYRALYGPLLTNFPRIPAPDTYRHPDCAACTGEALERAILAEGPESVAAFVAEPIAGSSLGAMVPASGYFERIERICRDYDILFVADEVMTGVGRTGRWFAFEHFAVVPDILVTGKGLSGGYAPLSALVAGREIVDTIARTTGYFNHAQTYSHTPVICAAGAATLRYMKANGLVERSRVMGERLFGALERVAGLPFVGDVRGRGLFAGIEIVADRVSKRPFARVERVAERVAEKALANGLVVWPNVGHLEGGDGDILMIAPPLVITTEQIDELVDLLERSLRDVLDTPSR